MNRKGVCFSRVRPYINDASLTFFLRQKDQLTEHGKYESAHSAKNHFFFSSGRASLKWLLKVLRKLNNRPLKVGVQAFSCEVVPQAILESGNYAIFFDISTEYYTTLIDDIAFEQIDILILTHLFGIPNPDYFRICEAAKSRKILVIDDLALTFKSSVGGQEIGSASDAAFYSFGFDKPVSCYEGGLLRVNNEGLIDQLENYFDNLPQEPHKKQVSDLRKLEMFYELFDKEKYVLGSCYDIQDYLLPIINFPQFRRRNLHRTLSFLKKLFNQMNKLVFDKVQRKTSSIRIFRMGQLKLDYLNTLWDLYPEIHRKRLSAADKAERKIYSLFGYIFSPRLPEDIQPSWHRLPMLVPQDKRPEIIRWGKRNGIEIGVYNWGVLCFEPFEEFRNLDPEKFPKSSLVKKQILNLPIWDEEIWKF